MPLIISILVTSLVIVLCLYLVKLLPLSHRIRQIAWVAVIVLGVLTLMRVLGALAAV